MSYPARQTLAMEANTDNLFSMSLATEDALKRLLERPGLVKGLPAFHGSLHENQGGFASAGARKSLPLDGAFGAGLDALLPDQGLPRGLVVEVSAPRGLARATSFALAACASAQSEARLRGTEDTTGAYCAWVEPCATLFAPAVVRAGVDPARLLVVRPTPDALPRTAVRVAQSGAFAVIVVDTALVPGALASPLRLDRFALVVRRLALAIEGTDTALVLLTELRASRAASLPVAIRLELERPNPETLLVRVAKDRRGRVASPRSLPLRKTA
jgi:hypothetical protein